MNSRICIFILLTALFTYCGKEADISSYRTEEIIDNVFTLELSFGDKDLPDEFLLASPIGPAIANNGDIIVTDEQRLKVFDNDGNPKQIIGRPGQGPGEFRRFPFACVMENGIISVTDAGRLSIYNPDYSFIDTKDFDNNALYKNLAEEKGWGNLYFNIIYAYSFDDILIYTQSLGGGRGKERKEYYLLLHQQGEKIDTIVESLNESLIKIGPITWSLIEKGMLGCIILPGHKVAYSETHKDKILENGTWYYLIHIYDLDTQERTRIKRPYNPVAIPDSVIHPELKAGYEGDRVIGGGVTPEGKTTVTRKEMDKKRGEILEELVFYPAIQGQGIFTDGNLLFAKTYEYVKGKGYVYEIFDIETGSYLRSAYFPFDPVIKNGYAYKRARSEEGFSIIEKYRIDPAVYGK